MAKWKDRKRVGVRGRRRGGGNPMKSTLQIVSDHHHTKEQHNSEVAITYSLIELFSYNVQHTVENGKNIERRKEIYSWSRQEPAD